MYARESFRSGVFGAKGNAIVKCVFQGKVVAAFRQRKESRVVLKDTYEVVQKANLQLEEAQMLAKQACKSSI